MEKYQNKMKKDKSKSKPRHMRKIVSLNLIAAHLRAVEGSITRRIKNSLTIY